jgi:predicted RNase H-like nuclease
VLSVLGIDAAWTVNRQSGIALVSRGSTGSWQCLCVAPSYASFLTAAKGVRISSWDTPVLSKEPPDVGCILEAASSLLSGNMVDVVTIDMPVSCKQIKTRRPADNAISKAFGAAKCSTHSPTPDRPGTYGARLTNAFNHAGFSVATTDTKSGTLLHLVEVYPHPALLRLCGAENRLEYKVGKSRKYWPQTDLRGRISNLLTVYHRILDALGAEIKDINLPLPTADSCLTLASLKCYEDAIDALVCAWVGCQYVDGRATAFGDDTAAIWIPNPGPIG